MRVIFIDNGVTGTIGYWDGMHADFMPTPVVSMQDYTKAKKNITRIDVNRLAEVLGDMAYGKDREGGQEPVTVVLERPLVNPMRFAASISAVRALEATLTVIETMMLPYRFCDSKEWQKGLLPSSGRKGADSTTLKNESRDIGLRLFPQFRELIRKHRDADGILGAYQFYQALNGLREVHA